MTSCPACGMGPKPLSLVCQCCGMLLLLIPQGPVQALKLPQAKKPREEQAPPLPPAKATSVEKRGQEKTDRQAGGVGVQGQHGNAAGRGSGDASPPGAVRCCGCSSRSGCCMLTPADALVWYPEMFLMVLWCLSLLCCKQGHRASQQH